MNLGQMFLVGFDGCSVDEKHWLVNAIRQDRLGGVILFDRNIDGSIQNIRSSRQLKTLTACLQQYAEIPLLIAVDQEGGKVCRLKERDGFSATKSAGDLGKLDIQCTREYANRMAAQLADHGINWNLAPVVDLDLNLDNPIISRYQRSFSQDPQRVINHARAFINAHHQHGIACCLKHFPGHGSAGSDSHCGFVDCTEKWQAEELLPFEQLIQEGNADAIMTAHIVQRDLDSDGLPATLSRTIISQMLRKRLGFSGVVVSDDLQMRAITDRWVYREAVQKAVLAGVDLLIVGNNLIRRENAVQEGVAAIKELLAQGKVSEQHIRTALSHITALKKKIAGDDTWKSSAVITS